MTKEEFDSAHAICPVCGSKGITHTFLDVMSNDGEYSDDVNSSVCMHCGWSGMQNALAPAVIRQMLIRFGTPTSNGMTFVSEDLELMHDRPLLGTMSSEDLYSSSGVDIRRIAAIAENISSSDAGVSIDIKLLYDNTDRPMPLSEAFYRLCASGTVDIAPAGYGRLDDAGIVRDFKLIGFYIKPH